jgi:phage repressor protein C with HTH and peptisase S24 domain
MASLNLTPARKRLSDAIAASDVWDLKKLSLEAGRSHAYLQQFITRNSPRVLPEDVREVLARLLGGDPNDYRDDGVPIGATRVHSGEPILTVPIYDIRASAGAGALVEDGAPTGFQPYREQELSRLTTSGTENLAVIQVAGDSMWETLHDGDKVLVDRTVNRVVRDGIYILAFEGELLVKRCQRDLQSGDVIVKSDNKAYDTFRITDSDRLDVIGRVIWIGRALG